MLTSYNGVKELKNHVLNSQTLMAFHVGENHFFCKTFTITLCGSTFIWFKNLPLHSITFFYDFAQKFMARFIIGVLAKRILAHMFLIIQAPNETLRDFSFRFKSKAL